MTDTTLIRRALEAAGYTVYRIHHSGNGDNYVLRGPILPTAHYNPTQVVAFSADDAWDIVCNKPIIPALIAAAFVELEDPGLYSYTDITHQAVWMKEGEVMETEQLPSRLEAMAAAIVAKCWA